MKRQLMIIAAFLVLGAAGLFLLSRHIQDQLVIQPYRAAVRIALDHVAAAQIKYRVEHGAYASDVTQLRSDPDSASYRGAHAQILAASPDGFLAEGRSDSWPGRCVIALGSFTGDSLKAGVSRCYSS